MANGAALALLPPADGSSEGTCNGAPILVDLGTAVPAAATPEERYDPDLGRAAALIDAILAALTDVSKQAVREILGGGLTNKTKMQGGDLLGRLVTLRSKIGERGFAEAMHRAGWDRGTPMNTAAIGEIIGVVGKIGLAVRQMN